MNGEGAYKSSSDIITETCDARDKLNDEEPWKCGPEDGKASARLDSTTRDS